LPASWRWLASAPPLESVEASAGAAASVSPASIPVAPASVPVAPGESAPEVASVPEVVESTLDMASVAGIEVDDSTPEPPSVSGVDESKPGLPDSPLVLAS
jgi:hypothetical protein